MTATLTIGQMLSAQARLQPERLAARDLDRGLTYREWNARACRLANALLGLGLAHGDRVAVLAYNRLEWAEIYTAVAKAGLVAVPINFRLTAPEVQFIVEDCAVAAILVEDRLAGVIDEIRDQLSLGEDRYVVIGDSARAPGYRAYETLLGAAAEQEPEQTVAPQDTWCLMYTSGTTGRPKGVRRHPPPPERAAWQAEQAARLFRIVFALDAGSRALLAAPLYHSAPASYLNNAAQVACTLYLQPRFDAEATLALIARERITHAYLVPTMFQRLLRLAPEVRARYDVSSIRHVASTGSPCPPEVRRAMIDWWGPVINECYASSETGYATFIDSAEWLAHPGSVGRALADATVRVLDDDGAPLPPGEVGTIYVRQPAYPDFSYINNDAARARIERDGLVTVGDMGWLDADGYLYITDRKSDMVISGGVNIYPAEIEAALHAMPEVADCAVFGIPHEEFGETLAAAVQLRPGCTADADAVRAFLRERIAGYKVPRVVEFHASLPREDTGKIFKRKLREPYWQGQARKI